MQTSPEGLLPCDWQLALAGEIDCLEALEAAPQLAGRIREFQRATATLGLEGAFLTRLVSAFNDRLTIRIIALTARRHRFPASSWCWLALGSEGRHEQTFVSDQDNGLIFNAIDLREADALRELFLPFAQEVNRRLADCGFKLCSGGIMAGNPAWCLSLAEWKDRFADWVRVPDPQALLNASIFFDLRPLCGDLALGENLRCHLSALTVGATAFLHLMAANALQAQPPLNFLGDVVGSGGQSANEIDLKKFGSRIFVDAARIFALASGTHAASTAARLNDSAPAAGLQAGEIASVDAAFSHILRLRLNNQLAFGTAAAEAGHGIPLDSLHDVDRAILKASLQQAKRLQQRLKLNYGL